jgi:enamine deaminase RidA (YjgF/YER057c/UK114 family)
MSVVDRLKELGLALPPPPKPVAVYAPAVRAGEFIFVSGQLPTLDGKMQYRGQIGKELTIEQAQEAARLAALNCLAAIGQLTALDGLTRIVKMTGYMVCGTGFHDHPKVLNVASTMLTYAFGDAGRHSRVALGVHSLPRSAPVEVDMIVMAPA